MVVFTCNNCGDSLQKPKVTKHYQFACRNPIFVTCVDCFKDFRGDEYVAHTKCITENERYGGKDYVQKPSANKGEKKQQAWLNIVQNVLANSNSLSVPERNLLNSISKHENIPRKKAKFLNFIRNLSKNRVNMAIVESVWDKMESAFKEATADKSTEQNNENKNTNIEENQNDQNVNNGNGNLEEEINVETEVKEGEEKKKKKLKKRPLETDENCNGQPANKKKAQAEKENESQEENAENDIDKFSWKNTIVNIVSTSGSIKLKKLRKKVVAQYLSNFPNETSEKARSKFEKKIKKISSILVNENKVKLASSLS